MVDHNCFIQMTFVKSGKQKRSGISDRSQTTRLKNQIKIVPQSLAY